MPKAPTHAPAPQDRARYDKITIGLHWLTVILVFTLFVSAEVWDFLPRGTPLRKSLQALHVSLGILLSAAVVLRVIWRAKFGRTLPDIKSPLPQWAARGAHHLLYLLLIGQILLGYLFRWAQGEEFSFFGVFAVPALLAPDRAFAGTVGEIHNIVGWTIIVLACGHAVMALIHHYALKDNTLKRMLP